MFTYCVQALLEHCKGGSGFSRAIRVPFQDIHTKLQSAQARRAQYEYAALAPVHDCYICDSVESLCGYGTTNSSSNYDHLRRSHAACACKDLALLLYAIASKSSSLTVCWSTALMKHWVLAASGMASRTETGEIGQHG